MTTCRDCGKQFQLGPLLDLPQPTRCLECLIGLEARYATLEAAAREALAVLTEIADSAAYWSDYDVPVGLVSRVDEAKARLAGVLG